MLFCIKIFLPLYSNLCKAISFVLFQTEASYITPEWGKQWKQRSLYIWSPPKKKSHWANILNKISTFTGHLFDSKCFHHSARRISPPLWVNMLITVQSPSHLLHLFFLTDCVYIDEYHRPHKQAIIWAHWVKKSLFFLHFHGDSEDNNSSIDDGLFSPPQIGIPHTWHPQFN